MKYSKKLLMVAAMLLMGANAIAQSIGVQGFVAAGGTTDNVYVAIGQPFYEQVAENGYEVSQGLAQAQIIRFTVVEDTCYGEGYPRYGFNFAAETPVGTYDSTRYYHNAQYNYDSVFTLSLTVNPTYDIYDTMLTDASTLPPGVIEGENLINGTSVAGCDSTVHLYVVWCGPVTDVDMNTYNAVIISGRCWTKENIRSEHYSDGVTAIPGQMVYSSPKFPSESDNLATYGRLYTWYSTVRVPENSTDVPTPDASGYVQGICPVGWHVPTKADMESLIGNPAPTLRSTNLWLTPGTNTTDFTALPAGEFNPNSRRFENLLGYTGFWSSTPSSTPSTTTSYYGKLDCWCGDYQLDETTGNYALSVRCVKN